MEAYLGIEFGSTRIKAVLTDKLGKVLAQGSYEWENQLVDGLWTYSDNAIWTGLRECYADLRSNVLKSFGCEIETLSGIGISAMMHGYLPFDAQGRLLASFRTWRNTNTGQAAKELSELFNFNVPLRWSISHLYQAILNGEQHVKDIDFITTLAGYVHWKLTGERVLGVGDASGMVPIDSSRLNYDSGMVARFESLVSSRGFGWKLSDILPSVLPAGAKAGVLTVEGAALLDASGHLKSGIPMCPPEGDAGTGMVATNAVRKRTGNVSAGTSSFSMIVLEKPLSRPYGEIDMVTTPDGAPVAMVHCNNCTSDLNGWVGLFREFQRRQGIAVDESKLFKTLFEAALEGDADCGGLLSYNFVSGEPVVGLSDGKPLFVRSASDSFTLSNFFRAVLYSTIGALKFGNDILFKREGVCVDRLTGHGGLFKSTVAGQKFLSAALNSPISIMETAGEGGPWGMALLASFMVNGGTAALPEWLDDQVFKGNTGVEMSPDPADVAGFNAYMDKYLRGLDVEKTALEKL